MFNNIFAVIHILFIKSSNHPDIFKINVDFTKKLVEASLFLKAQKNCQRNLVYFLRSFTSFKPFLSTEATSFKLKVSKHVSRTNLSLVFLTFCRFVAMT